MATTRLISQPCATVQLIALLAIIRHGHTSGPCNKFMLEQIPINLCLVLNYTFKDEDIMRRLIERRKFDRGLKEVHFTGPLMPRAQLLRPCPILHGLRRIGQHSSSPCSGSCCTIALMALILTGNTCRRLTVADGPRT